MSQTCKDTSKNVFFVKINGFACKPNLHRWYYN